MSDSINFGAFFNEDAPEIQEVLKGGKAPLTTVDFTQGSALPKLNDVAAAKEEDLNLAWKGIRSFFQYGIHSKPVSGLVPLLYAPFQDANVNGTDYPLWLCDETINSEFICKPLYDLLIDCIDKFAGDSEESILKNNISKVVQIVDAELSKNNQPENFHSTIVSALDTFSNQFSISGDEGKKFNKQIQQLKRIVPSGGLILPYSSDAPFLLFGALIQNEVKDRNNLLKAKIYKIKSTLNGLLAVEDEKGNQDPEKLDSSFSFASSIIDFEKVSEVLPESATEEMSLERRNRIKVLIEKLDLADQLLQTIAHAFIGQDLMTSDFPDWKILLGDVKINEFEKDSGCESIMSAFENEMKSWAVVFAAMQLAELEVKGVYSDIEHKEYYNNFNWRDFSVEEIVSCPPFILIAGEKRIASELGDFSTMLANGMPIKTIIIKRESDVDVRSNGLQVKNDYHHHQEVGAIAISHRNAYVCQSTAVKPVRMYEELSNGMSAALPGVFHILTFSIDNPAKSFMLTHAAVLGREFPGFTYVGGVAKRWGVRFNIDNNPQPQNEWPEFNIEIKNEKNKSDTLKATFTFADFASVDPKYSSSFTEIEQQYWTDDLIDLAEYLHLDKDDAIGKIPFIWMVDEKWNLKKVAVSWPLVLMCKERHEFWEYLQASSGINNFHVEQALVESKSKLEDEVKKEIELLKEEHKKELEDAVDEATNNAMDNLSASLLDLDTGLFTGSIPSSEPYIKEGAPDEGLIKETDGGVSKANDDQDDLSMTMEAYIDTSLCTTCNECTAINGNMFKYNGDKLAYIADVNAGTYAELVAAAELCPVGIIHPGDPVNPNEPGCEDLKKRAEKFN